MEGEHVSKRVTRQSGAVAHQKARPATTNSRAENRQENNVGNPDTPVEGQPQQNAQGGPKFSIFKMICLYLFISYVMQFFSSNKDPKSNKNLLSNVFSDHEPIVNIKHLYYLRHPTKCNYHHYHLLFRK